MRMLLLIFFASALTLTSCQSEYDKQMLRAKELVHQEILLKNNLALDADDDMLLSIKKVEDELVFRAHLSGNQLLFLDQVQELRVKEASDLNNPSTLITKYP
jgi:hypothetical protein